MSPEFLITTFIVVASPGTGVIYTLAAGLSRGARAAILAAFACTLGIIPHMLAAITGLAAVLYASAVAFEAIKIAGVAYLLYLAWARLREKGALRIETEMSPRSARQVIVTGIFALCGVFAANVREHIVSRPRVLTWMRRTFAAAFVALGLRLALTERA